MDKSWISNGYLMDLWICGYIHIIWIYIGYVDMQWISIECADMWISLGYLPYIWIYKDIRIYKDM